MTQKLLSVIVPSFNQGIYIRENLNELIAQRRNGIEVIVMDGGSTDGTKRILEELDGDLDYWVSKKDDGQASAINAGFLRSAGKWVAFQNSDDFYLPGGLDQVLAVMRSNSDVDIICGGTLFVDADGEIFKRILPKPIFFPALSIMNFINNQSLFVTRSFLERVGYLDPQKQFCLDYEWFVRLFAARPAIVYVHDYIGAQRFHEATKTTTSQHVHNAEFKSVVESSFSVRERTVGRLTIGLYRLFRLLYGFAVKLLGIRYTRIRGRGK